MLAAGLALGMGAGPSAPAAGAPASTADSLVMPGPMGGVLLPLPSPPVGSLPPDAVPEPDSGQAPPAPRSTPEEPEGARCFVSGLYRRVLTKPGFSGIALTVTLPQPVPDPTRGPADGFHIYLGGQVTLANGMSVVDAGLAWEITRSATGALDPNRRAWRPFIRTSRPSGYVYAPAIPDYYWYPGDEVTLHFEVVGQDRVMLEVSGAGKRFLLGPVPATGFNRQGANQALKWAVSLDQAGREGMGPVPTRARMENVQVRDVAVWNADGQLFPLTPNLVDKPLTCLMPDSAWFSVRFRERYAHELISIYGSLDSP